MALLWQDAADFANGSFETGDTTGWTVSGGTPRINSGSYLDGGAFEFMGGAAEQNTSIYQDIAIPADAKMIALSAIVGGTAADFDQGSVHAQFRDVGDDVIAGAMWISWGNTAGRRFPGVVLALVPAAAVGMRVLVRASRESAGTSNNGTVDAVTVKWLQGPDVLDVGSDLVTNGGFETGDLTGWTNESGTMETTTGANYVTAGTYAIRGAIAGGDGAYSQSVGAPPPGATGGILTAWLANTELGDSDEIALSAVPRDVSDAQLRKVTVRGPANRLAQVSNSVYFDLPAGTADVDALLEATLNDGTVINAGADVVEFKWLSTAVPLTGPGPYMSEQPTDIQMIEGATAVFRAVAIPDSNSTLSRQWYKTPAELLAGETGANLEVVATGSAIGARYYCVFTDDTGSTTSDQAQLSLYPVPTLPEPEVPVVVEPEVFPESTGTADYDYPCGLPGVLYANNANAPNNRTERNDLSSGPPLFVLRDEDGFVVFDVAWSYDAREMQVFNNWWKSTLRSGSRQFNIELVIDGWDGVKYTRTHEAYFDGPPSRVSHGRRWFVSARLVCSEELLGECAAESLENITNTFGPVPDLSLPGRDPDPAPELGYQCDSLEDVLLSDAGALSVVRFSDGTSPLVDLTGNGYDGTKRASGGFFTPTTGGSSLDTCELLEWENGVSDSDYWAPPDITGAVGAVGVVARYVPNSGSFLDLLSIRGNSRNAKSLATLRINANGTDARLVWGGDGAGGMSYIANALPNDGKAHAFTMTLSGGGASPGSPGTISAFIDGVQFAAWNVDELIVEDITEYCWGNDFGRDTSYGYWMQYAWVGAVPTFDQRAIFRDAYLRNFSDYTL